MLGGLLCGGCRTLAQGSQHSSCLKTVITTVTLNAVRHPPSPHLLPPSQGEEVDRKEHGKRKIRIENKWEMLVLAALQIYYTNK